jgi:Cleaved Adhesin Domain.
MKKVFLLLTMFLFAFTGVTRANVQQNRDDQVIEQGFEDGLGDWTMNHCHSSSGPTSSYGGNTGNYAFRFYYTANYPQYLISPELDDNDGVNLTFYAARYSSNYPETFKVGYSSTTNEPTEFTWDSEVTCTTMYGAGAYQEYSYDFPAGTKYVSIACTSNDQFYMFVDDITVTATEPAPAPTPGEIVEVTIGDPTSTDVSSYIPGYTLYEYAISQQIYTADEIGVAGTIETLTMWLKNNSSYARNINVYMTEVEATEFASTTDWVSMSADDMVASFTIENAYNAPIEFAIPLNTPFEYSGTGNLVICFQDVTGSWSSGLGGVVMDAAGNQAIYAYRDGTVYDPSNPGVNGSLLAKKNVIRLSIMTGGGEPSTFATVPAVLDLGYRPNGAWMAPYVFNMKSNVGAVTVNALDFSGNYFTYNAELPATVSGNNPLEVAVSTGTADEGEVNSTITILYSGNDRDAEQLNITATAYNPAEGDVFEQAVEVPAFTAGDAYATVFPVDMYKNYELPFETDANDAVYELTFNDDVLLSAGVVGGNLALYTADFNGEDGPMADNNYVYNGPEVAPGPTSLWFYHSYTGSNTWYGTSAGGGFYFGYKISTDVIAANELAGLTITTVEAAAREAYPYYCFIIEGGATPDEGDMIGYGEILNPTALYFFDINLEEPVYISGDSDIWVIFYSDSPYAGYCGRYPSNTAEGKIWTYNPNATTPMWSSNTTYTPVIYCHMLELPTGREVTMDLGGMKIKEGNGVASEIAEAEGSVMNAPKAQIAQNNRATEYQIEDMYVPAGTYYMVAAAAEGATININTEAVPAPEQAYVYSPVDGETNVTAPYLAEWYLGNYTTEMQVLLGTQYPPQTAMIDWTDELVAGAFITDLEPNQSYFFQVNERNAAGTTYGEIIAFTTPIDPVEGFVVEDDQLYPGDAAMFSWDANGRSLKGYNLYMSDGNGIVKVNENLITATEYPVEGLEYNMTGYQFAVTAVYDAGESDYSEPITVYMTGNGSVSGHVYDLDVEHPIAGATILAIGVDEYENIQEFEFTTDETGLYEGEILAGMYTVGIVTEGYENEAVVAFINYNQLTEVDDIITHEFYYPLGQITATEEADDVLVEWSWDPAELMIDFETGDFSQAEFTLPAQYPWAITTTNPYEGTYCMKSTCEGVASGTSSIEVTVDVPYDGLMGFWVRVSSEQNYDKFHFYIDGTEMGSGLSGQAAYAYKEYAVTEGTHTYKFEYAKDSSVNSNDDCIYVDNVTLYKQAGPAPSGMTYNFDDNSMMSWTSLDADGDGNGWVSSANPGIYHNSGVSLSGTGHNESEAYVISGSYANQTSQALTPDNYLVSPMKIAAQDGAAINFWACAQDASYAAEHFGVAVSTGSNTAAADFTTIQEWTMTAKGNRGAEEYSAVRGTRQGSWYEYNVDLSAYAGQEIWVAIRHFNCTDMFILNVDDITLGDGSEVMAPRGNREMVSYNLYRRNNMDAASVAEPELIAEGIDAETFEYTDAEWSTLSYGEWQWGIAATYDGYSPLTGRSRETATFGFEGGLEGWTGIVVNTDGGEWIHSDNNLGGYDYSELAHTGTGFAMCYSFVDYVGSFDTDAYLVSPQKYSVDANSSISFWADNANDSYPESFSVCVSTAANPTASDFVQIWSGDAKGTGKGGEINRRSDNRYENWRSHEVSLAAYAGQEIWIAFHDVNYDMYEIWIDDVTINYAGGAPVPPTPGPTGDGISEILWSNVIDKDMEATVDFNIALNNGQSPEGIVMNLTGVDFEESYTFDATGMMTVELRKGEYALAIDPEGYNPVYEILTIDEDEEEFAYILVELVGPVSNFYVSPTGWAMWEGATGGVTPTPPTPPTGILFEDDFEDGAITNWTTVDADGDGDTWQNATPASYGIGDAHSGTNCASSWSWNSVSMYPDNWMISPMVEGATSIQYYVATNTAYPDHYGIYASSTGTSTSDFTLVFEETAGSKGGNGVKSSMTQGSSREMSAWIEKNIELPAGTKYVAFRHWNSDDMNYLFIDDVTIEGASRSDRAPISYKMMLDGEYLGETYNPFYQFDVEGMEEGEVHVGAVAPLYASGMGDWMYYTWTYTSCSHFAGIVDFSGEVLPENTVKLNWTLPGAPVPPGPGGNSFTEDFENGLNWNVLTILADGGSWIHSDDNLGGYDYTTLAHSGTGFAMCYSFVDYVGSFNTDSYMYTTEKYNISNGSTLSFWADNANDSYPENFSVVISTVDNPTSAADFTQVWSGGAKGTGSNGAAVRRSDNRYENWRSHSIDLSAYAGQTVYIGFHDVNYDMYEIWIDDVELTAGKGGVRSNRDMWDLLGTFNAAEGGHYGVVTDGEYIYTSNWGYSSAVNNFYKYDMEGNVIEGFNISGCGTLRGMTFDGEYIYGVANSSTIYCVDLNNHTLVGTTTSAYGAMRGITYDPARDGFWVIGNWSGNLTLIDRTGAIVQAGPAPTSASDLAYYADPDGVEHVFCFNNGTNDVDDYNIATNTITPAVFNFNSIPGYDGGSSGGCHVATYAGKTAFFGDIQQSPNLIGIYELDGNAPVPPQPVEGVVGAILYRDGEFVGMFDATTTTYQEVLEPGEYTYTIRVIYGGDPDVTYYAMSCGDEVVVEWLSVEEDEVINSIYPNPTSSDLHINATAMRHITVFNAMGQVVYNQDVNSDEMVLNMSQLESGVYMVKVDTENGSSVKRITVVK